VLTRHSAQIVKRLTDNLQAEAVVLRIYCDSKATESQTRLMLLKSVLRQAVEQLITQRKLPVYIENAFHVNNENLEVKECKVLLGDILGEFTECIVAIDGLDEYEHFDPHRNEGIDILDDLHQALLGADKNRCHSKKLLIASRENCLKFYESSKSPFVGTTRLTELEFVAPNGDVEIVVRSHLQHGGFSFKEDLDSNPEIFNEVLEKVCAKSENVLVIISPLSNYLPYVLLTNRRFLVAHFHLQRLDKARSIRNLRENADGLPLGLNATWEDGLKSIIRQHGVEECDSHGQKEILGLRILAIVSKARRQLSIQELRHALAVEPRESSFDKYALLKNPDDIIKTTGGLLQIRQGDVDVFHKTLTDYLCRPDIRRKYFPEVDRLAEICLTYMNFTEFGEPCDDQAARREEFPLLQYAVRNIGYHVSDELARNPELLDDCLEFLRGPPPLGTFQVAVSPTLQRPVAFRMQKVREETPLLHMAVLFGMPFLLKKITMESETGSRGYKEETALHTAARAQQVEAATRLIDADADVNATSYSGKTPLDVIMNRPYLGFEIRARETFDVASILVEAAAERLELIKAEPGSDVTVDVEIKIRMVQMTAEDFQNMIGTDFRQKSKENAKDIAMLIALNDVSLDITDREGEIVMKLLDAGADVNSESMPEATALQLASIYGRQSIVKALLGKNANPFLTRSLGFTACDLARMREKYGKQGGQWKAVHEMLAEKMAEWQQKELDEPDEVKKLLIPGPKQAEQLEQKASDTYDLRMGRMFAESMAALGAVNDQPVETSRRPRPASIWTSLLTWNSGSTLRL
jgi:ankyrin repeat protein